jgi:2-oxoglutarate/2-oxoacid ferredoxin oxidoreductase subunit alpha
MKKTILIGGKAGQGINKISEIISKILMKKGYYVFNYRDYPSLIRGGHNFNVLSISDKRIGSTESKIDALIAMDDRTIKIHKKEVKKGGKIIGYKEFEKSGRNLNIAQASAYLKVLGISKKEIEIEIKAEFNTKESLEAVHLGYNSQVAGKELRNQNNKIQLLSGTQGIAQGAINSKLQIYIAYPMTPATGVMHELAAKQTKELMVFEGENEISCVSATLGASFTGALSMTGTSGGGFDLMSETLSLQGVSEIPLTVYLCSRPGPGTGVPTYSSQCDLDLALRAGHGEFPRIVVAPGNSKEAIEKTNEALFLAEKFNNLSVILSDKHLAESQFSFDTPVEKPKTVKLSRDLPHKKIVKASSYEVNRFGNSTESAKLTKYGQDSRMKKYEKMKKHIENNFEMIKIYGKKSSKNLIIGWGSTKSAILDATEELDCKFMQILYAKPLSPKVKKEMQKADNIILVENNQTGQMGRLLREKTGIRVDKKNRILKYDARPFWTDELKTQIQKRLK